MGGGPMKEELEQLAETRKADNVEFVGYIPYDLMASVYPSYASETDAPCIHRKFRSRRTPERIPSRPLSEADAGHEVDLITTTFQHWEKRQRDVNQIRRDQYKFRIRFIYEPGYRKNVDHRTPERIPSRPLSEADRR